MAADPYATLGVPRGASEREIKSAYRKLAKELHPDTNQGNDAQAKRAAERFSQVTSAYDLLSDKDKRARFDRGEIDADGNPAYAQGFGGGFAGQGYGERGFGGQRGFHAEDMAGFDGADLGDIFEGLFGGRGRAPGGGRRAPQRGANVQYRLTVSLPDAARLAPQRISLGDGKTIDLKLPPGFASGTQMRLAGKGAPAPDGGEGSVPGDAIITLTIASHPFFTADGDNVRLELPISLAEAVAGGRVRVPTVDGPVMLAVPAASSSGRVLRIKGRGFSRKDGSRGDQLVTLQIALPPAHSPAAEELGRRLVGWSDDRDPRAHLES